MEETIQKLQINRWDLNVSCKVKCAEKEALKPLDNVLTNWIKFFPREDTFINKEEGVPSILINVDLVLGKNGELSIYDIDETPRNVGIAYAINENFKKSLDTVRKTWPNIVAIHHRDLQIPDDHLWIETKENLNVNKDQLVLPRNFFYRNHQSAFANRSLQPIRGRGNKSFGVDMNLWKMIHQECFKDIPWEESFVIKPIAGENLSNLEIYIAKHNTAYRKVGGASTKSRIINTLRDGNVYCQKFIAPNYISQEKMFAVLKCFFAYNFLSKKYEILGGLQIKRNNLRIHGASDTTFAPLVLV